jgi:hypothetical protein
MKPAETAILRERICKRVYRRWLSSRHVIATINTHATMEDLLVTLSFVRSLPRLYNEDQLPLWPMDFSVDLPAALWSWPLTETCTRNLPGVKGGHRVRLTTSPPSVNHYVEADSNTSTAALQVVGGDEQGSQNLGLYLGHPVSVG